MIRLLRPAACLIIAIVLSVMTSLFIFEEEFSASIPMDLSMSITATGSKPAESWGTEVRIVSILMNGQPLDLNSLAADSEGWHMDGSLLVAYGATSPVTVNIPEMHGIQAIELNFIGQSGSGFAEISLNDKKHSINLYRNESWADIKWEYSNRSGLDLKGYVKEISCLLIGFFIGLMWLTKLRRMKAWEFVLTFSAVAATAAWLLLVLRDEYSFTKDYSQALYNTLFDMRNMSHGLVMLSMALWLPAAARKHNSVIAARISAPLRIAAWAVLFMAGAEFISNSGAIYQLEGMSILLGLLLHISLMLFVYGITGNLFAATCIISVVLSLLNAANYYTTLFRGTSLNPSDLNAVGTAMEVVGGYTFTFDIDMLVTIMFSIAACAVTWPMARRSRIRIVWRIIPRVAAICIGVAMVLGVNNAEVQEAFEITPNHWRIGEQYAAEGLTLTFVDSFGNMFVQKPDGYSEKNIASLGEKYAADDVSESTSRPDVIVIMNESFADLEEYEGLKTTEPVMPFLNSLKNRNNTVYGSVQVSILGGMTSKSEFEFLTGVNGRYCTTGSPYSTIVNDDIKALPGVMNELGYTSIAFHPEYKRNWNRDIAYPRLGFDDFISKDKTQNKEYLRGFISDEAFYKEIIDIDDAADEPLFLFGITMQNHGGYDNADFNEPLQIISPEGDFPKATQYLNLIRESDRAFEDFISHYEKSEEPVVILFFGDHLPLLDDGLVDSLVAPYETGTQRDTLLQYHTPYVIWANFDLNKELLPEDGSMISLSLMQSVLMEAADLPMTGFQKFLSEIMTEYPVISAGCVLDTEDNIVDGDSISFIDDYNNLQYALLKGKTEIFSYK